MTQLKNYNFEVTSHGFFFRYFEPGTMIKDGEKQFVQALVPDPLLIEGRKLDLSMYIVVTSLDPLVIYEAQG